VLLDLSDGGKNGLAAGDSVQKSNMDKICIIIVEETRMDPEESWALYNSISQI
jgi:hypothetical protein